MVKVVIILVTISLVAAHAALGAAATMCLGIFYVLIYLLRDMVWAATVRNDREKYEFMQVNNGHAEPDPEFLVRVWGGR